MVEEQQHSESSSAPDHNWRQASDETRATAVNRLLSHQPHKIKAGLENGRAESAGQARFEFVYDPAEQRCSCEQGKEYEP